MFANATNLMRKRDQFVSSDHLFTLLPIAFLLALPFAIIWTSHFASSFLSIIDSSLSRDIGALMVSIIFISITGILLVAVKSIGTWID